MARAIMDDLKNRLNCLSITTVFFSDLILTCHQDMSVYVKIAKTKLYEIILLCKYPAELFFVFTFSDKSGLCLS